jgi:hypothetical protein
MLQIEKTNTHDEDHMLIRQTWRVSTSPLVAFLVMSAGVIVVLAAVLRLQ